ncbi:MAG: hypothetical protein JWL83_150 [Actinomycetia bacterium]|nr:hypothetical protein [Actinomycetes bacterium]
MQVCLGGHLEHVKTSHTHHDREGPVYVNDRANLYIARTIGMPLPMAGEAANQLRTGSDPLRAFRLPGGGRLVLRLPLRQDNWRPASRRADLIDLRTAGMIYSRHNRRVCPVEVELTPWTLDTTEVSVRPAVRSPYGWGPRRMAGWFTHAHDAADTLRQALLERPEVIDLTDIERERVAV